MNQLSETLTALNIAQKAQNAPVSHLIEELEQDYWSKELSPLEAKIIECESGGDYTAKNPHSSAYGLGQFLNNTWTTVQERWDMTLERDNPEHQLYAFKRLLDEDGVSHWLESKDCWGIIIGK